jgi:hypothetical protein
MRSGTLQQVAVPSPKGRSWIKAGWNKIRLNAFLDLGLIFFNVKLHVQEWHRDEKTWIGLTINNDNAKWGLYFALTKPYAPWTAGPEWRHWPHLVFRLSLGKHICIETEGLSLTRAVKDKPYTSCVYQIIRLHVHLFGWKKVRELYSPDMPKNVCFAS